ncbi:MAG: ABC transporter ATP-binding protein [Gammaproteobacteria bacterium]|nr:ABC transporter ATP-binding protein [Gammaproteobacteria bacterium]
MSVIVTEHLAKTFWRNKVALQGLDLEVKDSEVFGLFGPKGAGKSTTIRLLLNFLKPTRGTARLFGEPANDTTHRHRLGYLPEDISLPRYYTGRSLLDFCGRLSRLNRPERERRTDHLLERFRLKDDAASKISKYSPSATQWLGIAQALMGNPDLLILDEPLSNFSTSDQTEFGELIHELRNQGTTVFLASHAISQLGPMCDRLAILDQGELKRLEDLRTWEEKTEAQFDELFLDAVGKEAASDG